jgi:preprotein translocase subunit SecE
MANIASFPLVKYLREAREELQKVTWPSQKEVIRYSLVVMAVCLFFGAYFGGLDFLLSKGLAALIELSQ